MIEENRIEFDSKWLVNWHVLIACLKLLLSIFIYLIKQIVTGFGIFKNIPEKNVKGQLVLVTGSSNGIGRVLSIEFAKRKCNLVLIDQDEENGKKLAEDLIRLYKIKAKFYKVDVSIYAEMEKLKIDIEKDVGFVDILVNNAGLIPFMQTLNPKRKPEDVSKLFDVNVKAHLWGIKLFLPGMIKRKRGHIVATCSFAGIMATPYLLDYIASKGAVRFLMDAFYYELRQKAHHEFIKTSLICPTPVLTNKNVIKRIKATKIDRFFHVISPEETGEIAVKAILKNKRIIIIPKIYTITYILNIFPDEALEVFFDTVFEVKEAGFEGE